jgi:hypothetical protein
MKFMKTVLNNSALMSQKPHCVSITKNNRLMLFKEITTVYCKNDTVTCRLFLGIELTTCSRGDTILGHKPSLGVKQACPWIRASNKHFLEYRNATQAAVQITGAVQCMRLTDHVTFNFNNKMSTAAAYFDTTWHSGLLYKLPKLEFSTSLIKLIDSFHHTENSVFR